MSSAVPFVDLKAQHAEVAEEVNAGFARIFDQTAFVMSDDVAAFEREFAAFLGAGHCVGVGNGTDAIEIALRAAGIGAGDEVILPANTFIATAEAVVRAGAQVVLADCDAQYMLLDPAHVAKHITPRTRAIVAVHLYGQLAPMEELAKVAKAHGLLLFEDAAQSQGATRHGRHMGAFGLAAPTSFYAGKNIGAYGEAGAVVCNDDELARRMKMMRVHGSETRYVHEIFGFNSRLDSLQAVVLRAKLKRLAAWNAARRQAAARYAELLGGLPQVRLPQTLPGNEHVWHLYVVRVPKRDETLKKLQAEGIGAAIHYPIPIHLQKAFAFLGKREGAFPNAEAAAREILSLPMFPHITAAQQERVAQALRRAL